LRRSSRCRSGRCANCAGAAGVAREAAISASGVDLVAVDGFEADFASWGGEDSDLLIRLMRAGVWRRDGRMATGVLHLWHAEADRSRLRDNERRLDAILASKRIRAERGLSALSQ